LPQGDLIVAVHIENGDGRTSDGRLSDDQCAVDFKVFGPHVMARIE
jgi:hypothetical protein